MNTNSLSPISGPAPIFPDLHDLCVKAFNQMIGEGIEEHVSYISAEDPLLLPLPPGKIGKVIISIVDEAETIPEEDLL